MITCAGQRNRRHTEAAAELIDVAFGFQEVLFDPQTSGGLLISCEASQAPQLLEKLKEKNPAAAVVGQVTEQTEKLMTVF